MDEEKVRRLELARAKIEKDHGKNVIFNLGGNDIEDWPCLPTGAINLDLMMGGGFSLGRIVEIFGAEGSGKSTLALTLVAEAQKQGQHAVYIDLEQALDPKYMHSLGIDFEKVMVVHPTSGENAFNIANDMIRTGAVGVVVVDSVAAIAPQKELDGDVGDQTMGRRAALIAQAITIMLAPIAETKTLVVFINQNRDNLGMGKKTIQPGGRSLKYYASQRLDLQRIETLKDKHGLSCGIRVKAQSIKNKIAAPYRETEFDILFGQGINKTGCLVDLADEKGVINKSGSWYSFEEYKAQGREKFIDLLDANVELAEKIRNIILNG